MKIKNYRHWLAISALITGSLLTTGIDVNAGPMNSSGMLDKFDSSWSQFQARGAAEDGSLAYGPGRQRFDTEYLLYKLEGNNLSIALQTGFNVKKGKIRKSGKSFFGGDLALSFDGDASSNIPSSYEYAVDFGLRTKDNDGQRVGARANNIKDRAGVYTNVGWNTNLEYDQASPFAMDEGTRIKGALLANKKGKDARNRDRSFYRIVTLDLAKILGEDWASYGFNLDTHWTMSCGNDDIYGGIDVAGNPGGGQSGPAPVPEPATMLLFGAGLVGLGGVIRKRNIKK